jgi:6-phosphofructokinase 1
VLGSARCPQFQTEQVRGLALHQLDAMDVDGLVVIGGNGSQAGAHALSCAGVAVAGVSSTVDNDLYGADITIGVDTALNIALESVDRLKTTAASLRRAFLVEVMGRDCGYLALAAGVAGGAEAVVVPEIQTSPDEVAGALKAAYERGNDHAVVVVAEGAAVRTDELLAYCQQHEDELGFELRATVLGHVQRGGAPGAFDRLLSSRLGAAAVAELAKGNAGVVVGLLAGRVTATPLADAVGRTKPLDPELVQLTRTLTR